MTDKLETARPREVDEDLRRGDEDLRRLLTVARSITDEPPTSKGSHPRVHAKALAALTGAQHVWLFREVERLFCRDKQDLHETRAALAGFRLRVQSQATQDRHMIETRGMFITIPYTPPGQSEPHYLIARINTLSPPSVDVFSASSDEHAAHRQVAQMNRVRRQPI